MCTLAHKVPKAAQRGVGHTTGPTGRAKGAQGDKEGVNLRDVVAVAMSSICNAQDMGCGSGQRASPEGHQK